LAARSSFKLSELLFPNQSNGRRARADTNENLQAHLVRATKAVKREDVMRDALTFHVLRITPVANSASIAAEIFSQAQTTLFSRQYTREHFKLTKPTPNALSHGHIH